MVLCVHSVNSIGSPSVRPETTRVCARADRGAWSRGADVCARGAAVWRPALVLRPARWVLSLGLSRSHVCCLSVLSIAGRRGPRARRCTCGVLCDARENGACLYTTQSKTTTTTEAVPVVSGWVRSAFERGQIHLGRGSEVALAVRRERAGIARLWSSRHVPLSVPLCPRYAT